MRIIYTIIIVLLMMFVITFSLENTLPISLKYYHLIDLTVPTYMLLFLSFLVGVIFAGFMGIVERFRLNRTINRLNKTIRELKREIREGRDHQITEKIELSPEKQ